MALLEVEDLKVHFFGRHGVARAVDGVSFSIDAGEVVGLVGESGSGKSVTALAILRILARGGRIVGGQVRFDGRDLLTLSPTEMRRVRGNGIAMIFQDPMASLNPTMTVGRQIAESYYLHRGGGWGAAYRRAAELLDAVGVADARARLHDFPHQFSGGMRQRVMIAMALACSPRLLIADEPTTALDVTVQAQILALLHDLQQQLGMAVLLITHDMGILAESTDRVIVMYAGQIVEQAGTVALFEQRLHPYTEALLACVPRLDSVGKATLANIPGQPPNPSDFPPGCRFAPRCNQARLTCGEQLPVLESPVPGRQVACFYPLLPTGGSARLAAVASQEAP